MPSSSHSSHRHRKKNPIDRFFDRLRGKSSRRSYRRSEFPGINLPQDHDPEARRRADEEKPEFLNGEEENKYIRPESPAEKWKKEEEELRSKGKGSLFSRIDTYFKIRALRKEQRNKERLKRKIRRKHQKEYRKQETGRSVREKLFTVAAAGDLPEKKSVPLFSQRSSIYRNLTIILNSTVIYILTYVIAYLLYWTTSMLVASWYGLDSILYFYDLEFNNHSPLWSRFNILLVTGIPPFLCLFLGLWLYRVLFKKERFVGLQKLFILWLSFHLFNHFFGAFPSGVVTDEGFGYVAAWMYMNTAFKFLFSMVSLFFLGLIGYYSAQHILETSDSMSRIKPENRVSFILAQAALPWLIGTVIMLLVRMPHNFDYPYETLMLFTMAFIVIPPFFNEKVKPRLNLVKVKKRRTVNLGYLVMMLAFLAFLRIMLGIGLHFVIRMEISISPAIS